MDRNDYTTKNGNTRLLKPAEVAEILGISEATLATWRCVQRYNLPFVKIGKNVMYRFSDVEQFIEDNLQNVA